MSSDAYLTRVRTTISPPFHAAGLEAWLYFCPSCSKRPDVTVSSTEVPLGFEALTERKGPLLITWLRRA